MSKSELAQVGALGGAGVAGAALTITFYQLPMAGSGDILQFLGAMLGAGLGALGAFGVVQWQRASTGRASREYLARIVDAVAGEASRMRFTYEPQPYVAVGESDVVPRVKLCISWIKWEAEQLYHAEILRDAGHNRSLQFLKHFIKIQTAEWESWITHPRISETTGTVFKERLDGVQACAVQLEELCKEAAASLRAGNLNP